MNFPMELPFFQFMYWLVNTAGIGGAAILTLGMSLVTAFLLALRWILSGGSAEEEGDFYSYPTPTLLGHDNHD